MIRPYWARHETRRAYRLYNVNPKVIEDVIAQDAAQFHPSMHVYAHALGPWEANLNFLFINESLNMTDTVAWAKVQMAPFREQEITELRLTLEPCVRDSAHIWSLIEQVITKIVAAVNAQRAAALDD